MPNGELRSFRNTNWVAAPFPSARRSFEEFEAQWGERYPAIGQAWRRAWEHVVPLFAFAPGIRKMIDTTNAVEALHRSMRKIIKTRGSFPNDDAPLSCFPPPSECQHALAGGGLNGRPRWANLQSSSARV